MSKPTPHSASNSLHVPKGFAVLLEMLAREVLRSQPLDIVSFSAKYFDEQLLKRNETNIDITQNALESERRTTNDQYFGTNQNVEQNMQKERAVIKIQSTFRGYKTRRQTKDFSAKQSSAATTIQKRYRKHLHQLNKQSEQMHYQKENAAVKIQAHYKGYKTRQTNIHKKKELSATKIQAAFRGYQSRKLQGKHDPELKTLETAATKIQSTYRGYKVRKNLKEKQEGQELD